MISKILTHTFAAAVMAGHAGAVALSLAWLVGAR